jgi:hypothetical protein
LETSPTAIVFIVVEISGGNSDISKREVPILVLKLIAFARELLTIKPLLFLVFLSADTQ